MSRERRTTQSRRVLPLRRNGSCNIQSLRQNQRASPIDDPLTNKSTRAIIVVAYCPRTLHTHLNSENQFVVNIFRQISLKCRNLRGNKAGPWGKAYLFSLSNLQDPLQSRPHYPLRLSGFPPFLSHCLLCYHSPYPFPSHPSLPLRH